MRRRKPRWSKKDVDFILENYHKYSARELADKLGKRTMKSVLRKVEELRKKGKIEPLDGDAVKNRVVLRQKIDDTDILEEGFIIEGVDYEYEEL